MYKFSDICKVINGRAYSYDELLECGKYPVLRVGNFFSSDKWYYSEVFLYKRGLREGKFRANKSLSLAICGRVTS